MPGDNTAKLTEEESRILCLAFDGSSPRRWEDPSAIHYRINEFPGAQSLPVIAMSKLQPVLQKLVQCGWAESSDKSAATQVAYYVTSEGDAEVEAMEASGMCVKTLEENGVASPENPQGVPLSEAILFSAYAPGFTPHHISVSQLADLLYIPSSRIPSGIRPLIQQGLVARVKKTIHARNSSYRLTAEGKAKRAELLG